MQNVKENIMFHYFYDNIHHPFIHGALTANRFEQLVTSLIEQQKLIGAEEWLDRFNDNKLEGLVALTFDDGLLSQFEIAYPVLKKYKITAFWFVNTSPFLEQPINMELFRRFKHEYFKNTDDYYELFFNEYENAYRNTVSDSEFESYLSAYSFYTFNDRKYRYIRDLLLSQEQYEALVMKMITKCKWPISDYTAKIWISRQQLKELSEEGNSVGLHTHSHPINFKRLDKKAQFKEYELNQNIIQEITGIKTEVMAHPINSYNNDTLDILKELGVKLGFCSTNKLEKYSSLEMPRIDHALLKY